MTVWSVVFLFIFFTFFKLHYYLQVHYLPNSSDSLGCSSDNWCVQKNSSTTTAPDVSPTNSKSKVENMKSKSWNQCKNTRPLTSKDIFIYTDALLKASASHCDFNEKYFTLQLKQTSGNVSFWIHLNMNYKKQRERQQLVIIPIRVWFATKMIFRVDTR